MLPSSRGKGTGREGRPRGPLARPPHLCSAGEQATGRTLLYTCPGLPLGPYGHFALLGLELTCVYQPVTSCSAGLQHATGFKPVLEGRPQPHVLGW